MRSGDEILHGERAAVERIRAAHEAHRDRVRRQAMRLAGQAAELTEEGIRDLVDEDDEADTAVRAALVRQGSAEAMAAARRVAELEALGDALAFGHVTDTDGERCYVGRISVFDDDEVLLVDWRAPVAIPFYRATPLDPLGMTRRRHLHYGDGAASGELVAYSDEVFDADELLETSGLRGEAALLAAVEAPTPDQMRSVVATLQAEQDAVIRAPSRGALVVQGSPGTGKTVVALHRAAYLLYDRRVELAERGVLIVGPSPAFLSYIAGVLPSLGESGVVSRTISELYPGVRRGEPESAETATLKGQLVMADLLAAAVADRQRPPTAALAVRYGTSRVRLELDELSALFTTATRQVFHNDGALTFEASVLDALAHAADHPAFSSFDDARAHFARSSTVRAFLIRHFPLLSAEQALNDLFGSPGLLRSAGRRAGLSRGELAVLARDRTPEAELDDRRWSEADLPLLDELRHLLGPLAGSDALDEIGAHRDEADEFELAEADEGNETHDDDDDTDLDELSELSWEEMAENPDLFDLAAYDQRREDAE